MNIKPLLSIAILACMLYACKPVETTSNSEATAPQFTIGVKAINSPPDFPYLQSFTWGRQGNQILLFGGRTEGFHGLNQMDTIFKASRANTAISVINLDDFSYTSLPLDLSNPANLNFTYTNMQFCQVGDTLFTTGGFGQSKTSDLQGNFTGSTMMAISVSKMISIVQQKGNPQDAILMQTNSPDVKVTGGEMVNINGWFYLMFGQVYDTVYTAGVTGDYTSAIRKFRFVNSQITDTLTYRGPNYRRRDLSIAKITGRSKSFVAAFGGVFTPDGNGYSNPVYLWIYDDSINETSTVDTLVQKTSQYNCATASIYDPASDACITVLFGGIGQYQYHPETRTWEEGDKGAKLPFVRTITQMIFDNDVMKQKIQIPPGQPELPELIGASAAFFPNINYLLDDLTIDYSKLTADTTDIGILYGGIASPQPTSSSLYPTTLNKTIYRVMLYKTSPQLTH